MTKVIYAGSFDPLTNGHLWIIHRAAKLFDEVVVAIGNNTGKKYFFDITERKTMLEESTADLPNVKIEDFVDDFLVRYAKKSNADCIIRGIRNTNDFEFEKQVQGIHNDICSDVDIIYLIPPQEYVNISSSFVKGFMQFSDWESIVALYVPNNVLLHMKDKYVSNK